MDEYQGQIIRCPQSYLVMFKNDESSFAILHNDCADLMPVLLVDCSGNELCTYVTDDGCLEMVLNSETVGVIGVKN